MEEVPTFNKLPPRRFRMFIEGTDRESDRIHAYPDFIEVAFGTKEYDDADYEEGFVIC
jgi:hypothetical protein